ncbi:molybdenum cofactor biosynthesis protein B [Abditibacteriota bacterium]|nr:molybdenum cofactor biosynthesis protein B [Abditibacteriota bacterium]
MSKSPKGQKLQQPQAHATLQNQDDQSQSTNAHRAEAPDSVRVAVIVVSDTRTLETDKGGLLIEELLEAANHLVASRQIVRDDLEAIKTVASDALSSDAEVVILTGGSGIGPRDVTPEAIHPMLTRELPGFGEVFRVLSFEQIGSATMLSRAFAGVVGRTLVFVLPGSTNAVRLALEKLIVPEIGHLVREVRPERRK